MEAQRARLSLMVLVGVRRAELHRGQVLRLVMGMVAAGTALAVPGNHENKLLRALRGRNVQVSHGLEQTLSQLAEEPDALSRFGVAGGGAVWTRTGRPFLGQRLTDLLLGRVRECVSGVLALESEPVDPRL